MPVTSVSPAPVVACAVVHQEHVLLVQRAFDPGAGRWAFPAGFVETAESAEEAMARELREETGLELEVRYRRSFGRVIDDGRAFLSLLFEAETGTREITTDEEALDHRWVPLDIEVLEEVDWAFRTHRTLAMELAEER
jgi:ADP-ribose pyrophosphatase YjhB (NUDIX family)